MKTKKVEKLITTLKDWIGHPLKRHFTETLTWVNNLKVPNMKWMPQLDFWLGQSEVSCCHDCYENVMVSMCLIRKPFRLEILTTELSRKRSKFDKEDSELSQSLALVVMEVCLLLYKDSEFVRILGFDNNQTWSIIFSSSNSEECLQVRGLVALIWNANQV